MKKLVWFAAFSVLSLQAAELRVDCSYAGDDPDGSEERPFRSLADAAAAAQFGDTVRVAPGRYELPSGASFTKQKLKIVADSSNPADTILDGCATANPIVRLASNSGILSGFTLTNGVRGARLENGTITNCVITCCRLANRPDANEESSGAGVWCKGGAIRCSVIRDCTIELDGEHVSNAAGAGIFVNCSANVGEIPIEDTVVTNCAVLTHSSANAGGKVLGSAGVYTLNNGSRVALRRCRIVCNRVENGMAGWGPDAGNAFHLVDNSIVEDCEIYGNTGAMLCYAKNSTVSNCTFRSNDGGYQHQLGFKFEGTSKVTGCLFEANTNRSNNGGVVTLRGAVAMRNCVLTGNATASCRNAGIHFDTGTGAVAENCIIEGSVSDRNGGAISATGSVSAEVRNCRIRNCSARDDGALVNAAFSAAATGGGILVRNCLFENCEAGKSAVFASNATAARRVRLESCTFAGNICGEAFFAISSEPEGLAFENCLFAGNAPAAGMGAEIGGAGTHSLVLETEDAFLEDPASGKYRPLVKSPAADAGIARDWMEGELDLGDMEYERLATGVLVVRNGAKPMLRDGKASIGCFRSMKGRGFRVVIR